MTQFQCPDGHYLDEECANAARTRGRNRLKEAYERMWNAQDQNHILYVSAMQGIADAFDACANHSQNAQQDVECASRFNHDREQARENYRNEEQRINSEFQATYDDIMQDFLREIEACCIEGEQ